MVRAVLCMLGCAVASGCNLADVSCPQIAAPAVLLQIREAGTGFPAADGARGIVQDGTYSDSLRVVAWEPPAAPDTKLYMAAAFDRPGTYSVTLEKQGYQTFQQAGVVVGTNECGTEQAQITVMLVPVP